MNVGDLISRNEGLRLKPYLDTATPPRITIAYGRNLSDKGVSPSEAALMRDNDIAECRADLAQYWWFNPLDEVRQAAIIDMRYNLGLGGLLHFPNMIAAIGRKDWQTAHDECADQHWVAQVGERARIDAQMLLTGEWPT